MSLFTLDMINLVLTTIALILIATTAQPPAPTPDVITVDPWGDDHIDGDYRAITTDRPGTFSTPEGDMERVHYGTLTEVKVDAETAEEAEQEFNEKWEETKERLIRIRIKIGQLRGDTIWEGGCQVTVGTGGFSEWTPVEGATNRWRRQVKCHVEVPRYMGPPE